MDAPSRIPKVPNPADNHKHCHQTCQNGHQRRNRHQPVQAGRIFKVQAWHAKGRQIICHQSNEGEQQNQQRNPKEGSNPAGESGEQLALGAVLRNGQFKLEPEPLHHQHESKSDDAKAS